MTFFRFRELARGTAAECGFTQPGWDGSRGISFDKRANLLASYAETRSGRLVASWSLSANTISSALCLQHKIYTAVIRL